MLQRYVAGHVVTLRGRRYNRHTGVPARRSVHNILYSSLCGTPRVGLKRALEQPAVNDG